MSDDTNNTNSTPSSNEGGDSRRRRGRRRRGRRGRNRTRSGEQQGNANSERQNQPAREGEKPGGSSQSNRQNKSRRSGGQNQNSTRQENARDGSSRRRGRRRGGRRRNRKPERPIEELEQEHIERIKNDDTREKPICPMCGEPIYLVSQSIIHKESGKPACFDCIIKMLHEKNTVEESEKVVYLGAGSFGIIRETPPAQGKVPFFVRERIQYEERTKDGNPRTREHLKQVNDDHDEEHEH